MTSVYVDITARCAVERRITVFSRAGQWWDSARASAGASRRHVAVVLMDRLRTDVNRWTFSGAIPYGYSVSPLNALGGEPLIETLELSVGDFRAAFGPSGQSDADFAAGTKRRISRPRPSTRGRGHSTRAR